MSSLSAIWVAFALAQAPVVDVPAAPVAPPEMPAAEATPPQNTPAFVQRLHLVQQDPLQGSFRGLEVATGTLGGLAGSTAAMGLAFAAFSIATPHATFTVRPFGFSVTGNSAGSSDAGLASAVVTSVLAWFLLPPLGAGLGAALVATAPRSGSLARAFGYALLAELAVEVVFVALVGVVPALSSTALDVTNVAVNYAAMGLLASYGLHDGPVIWVQPSAAPLGLSF